MGFIQYLKSDLKRYMPDSVVSVRSFFRIIMRQQICAILIFRFGHWVSFDVKSRIFRFIFKPFYIVLNKIILEIILGLYIPAQCDIGPGLYIAGNFLGLVINPNAKIGKNCTLGHGVVIGTAANGTPDAPMIGNNVFIGSGAVLIGGIEVGDDVKIGANTVVNKNIPSSVTVVSQPFRIINQECK
jgi:serine O-acetyltransferase